MSTEEVAAIAPSTIIEDQPASDPAPIPSSDVTPPAKKAKAKPSKSKASSKPRAPLAHPRYAEMISEAISTLKERTGSSQYAITKFIEDKHKSKLSSNFKKIVLLQLKKLASDGKLIKVKASYKLSSSATKTKKPAAAKPKVKTATKPKAKTSAKPKAKTVAKTKKAAAPAKKTVAPAKKSAAAGKIKKVAPKPKAKAPVAKVAKKRANETPSKKKVAATIKKADPAKKPTALKKTLVKKAASVKKAAAVKGKK